jgi:Protein of unknown function (DUF2867)
MRVESSEFRKLDLRCHALLSDARLHDVWAITLEDGGRGRTMRDVHAVLPSALSSGNRAVRSLFALRLAIGRRFGWDEGRHDPSAQSYVQRLTDEDQARSLVPPATRMAAFRVLYLFADEAVYEVRNATAHAFLAAALAARADGYVLYWAIYVKPVSRLTSLYMAMIDPFRRLVVYPALIRQVEAAWERTYGPTGGAGRDPVATS